MNYLPKISRLTLIFAFIAMSGCSNAVPTVAQLYNFTAAPTLNGSSTWTIGVADKTSNVTVAGQCDIHAQNLEYSLDNGATWIQVSTIAGADSHCADGGFSFSLANPFISVTATQVPMLLRNIYGTGRGDNATVTFNYSPETQTSGARLLLGGSPNLTTTHGYQVAIKVVPTGKVH